MINVGGDNLLMPFNNRDRGMFFGFGGTSQAIITYPATQEVCHRIGEWRRELFREFTCFCAENLPIEETSWNP